MRVHVSQLASCTRRFSFDKRAMPPRRIRPSLKGPRRSRRRARRWVPHHTPNCGLLLPRPYQWLCSYTARYEYRRLRAATGTLFLLSARAISPCTLYNGHPSIIEFNIFSPTFLPFISFSLSFPIPVNLPHAHTHQLPLSAPIPHPKHPPSH